jgi:uncharacterized protein YbjT (DUF2867 family)
MPVIVIGADTPVGFELVTALVDGMREVRAFVSDPDRADQLRSAGVKVATGDVSDASHVAGACTNVFSVVLIAEAARDDRERAFAADEHQVLSAWVEAVGEASVGRVIWVDAGDPPHTAIEQEVVVSPQRSDLVTRVRELDDAASIPPRG